VFSYKADAVRLYERVGFGAGDVSEKVYAMGKRWDDYEYACSGASTTPCTG
jgi:hypothetical protein